MVFDYTNTEFSMCRGRQRCQGSLINSRHNLYDMSFYLWTIDYGNGSLLKNPNISGALYTLRIQYLYTQTQCEGGARDVRVL